MFGVIWTIMLVLQSGIQAIWEVMRCLGRGLCSLSALVQIIKLAAILVLKDQFSRESFS